MAKYYVTRGAGGFNSALPFTFTLSPLVFARAMTRALVELTAAEHELDDDGSFDPALFAYQSAVDEARSRVLGHCEALIAQPPATLQAACLQRVAVLVATVVQSSDQGEVARIRSALTVARWVWQLPTTVPAHGVCNATLDRSLNVLAAYIDGPLGPQDSPPAAGLQMVMGAGPAAHGEYYPVPVAHTEVSAAFTALLRDLDACVAAEQRIQRDVVGDDVFAPEVAADLTAAEAAREDLLARIVDVTALPLKRDLDHPLRLLVRALHALLSVEDDSDRQHIHGVMAGSVDLLLVEGSTPTARRVRALQCRYFGAVARLMSMADYGGKGSGPEDDHPDVPGLAA